MLRHRLQAADRRKGKHLQTPSTNEDTTERPLEKCLGSSAVTAGSNQTTLEDVVFGAESAVEDLLRKPKKNAKKHKSDSGLVVTKQPAWLDEDDIKSSIVLEEKDFRYRKIRKAGETTLSADLYVERLRTQFEKTAGGAPPSWARPDFKPDDDNEDASNDIEIQSLYSRTGNFIAASDALPQSSVNIKQCTDANKESPSQGKVKSVEFHKQAQVVLVAGMDHNLNLFQVDGKKNPKIQSVFLEKFPVYCAHFSASGEEVIAGSRHKSFYYYDMIAGKVVSVPPIRALNGIGMQRFEVSPCGRFLAFLGKHGHIHVLSAKSKEWLFDLKMNGSVEAIAFDGEGSRLYSVGDDGVVYVWSTSSRTCLHKFYDDGCVKGTALASSFDGQYLACGSYSGVVNVYDSSPASALLQSATPKPLKSLLNLVTPCTGAVFNRSSELLAISSNYSERALKLVHLPSLTVFSNYPERTESVRIPLSVDFSPNCGYMAVGDHRGQALLYRLKHYGNY